MTEDLIFEDDKHVSNSAKNLLKKMLSVKFSERITYRELFTHDLFKNYLEHIHIYYAEQDE